MDSAINKKTQDPKPVGFAKPKCAECGGELEPSRINVTPRPRYYCEKCAPLGNMKEGWKPFGGSFSVQAIFEVGRK